MLVETGCAIDLQSLRAPRLPHPRAFDRPFHRLCGSSTVARLRRAEPDALRCDRLNVLGSHHQWVELARDHGAALPRLPVAVHGPYADWREAFTAAMNREGAMIEDRFAARFGLTVDQIGDVSEHFFPPRRTRATVGGPRR